MRLVHDAGQIRVDGQKSAAGRGAHLHDDADCFALAVRRRAIGRALHRTGEVVLSAELLARFEPATDPTSVDAGDSAAADPTSVEIDHTSSTPLG